MKLGTTERLFDRNSVWHTESTLALPPVYPRENALQGGALLFRWNTRMCLSKESESILWERSLRIDMKVLAFQIEDFHSQRQQKPHTS